MGKPWAVNLMGNPGDVLESPFFEETASGVFRYGGLYAEPRLPLRLL